MAFPVPGPSLEGTSLNLSLSIRRTNKNYPFSSHRLFSSAIPRWGCQVKTLSSNHDFQLFTNTLQLEELASRIREIADTVYLDLDNGERLVLSRDFIQWLRGFTDAEGSFTIGEVKNSNSFAFCFQIFIHIDDLQVLTFIKETLKIGNIVKSPSLNPSRANLRVSSQSELYIILAIFAKYNLNSTKHLNFLSFVSAFQLYTKNRNRASRMEIKSTISKIISSMNSGRANFDMPDSHKINITNY